MPILLAAIIAQGFVNFDFFSLGLALHPAPLPATG
jgi:hypothetical protein